MSTTTTIELRVETKKKLDDLKIIERESYDSVVQRLIKKESGK